MKRALLLALTLLGICGAALGLQSAPAAYASTPKDAVCEGLEAGGGGGGCSGGGSLTDVIRNVINIFSIIIGIVAVIMVMIGGFKFITASGDAGNISSAKSTIVYALVGLVIVALAQAMVQFVLKQTK